MRVADLVTASVLLLVGGVVVFDAVGIGIGWGTDGPKSGFFPFWLGMLLIAACALILGQAARRVDAKPFVRREQLGPVLKVLWPAVALVVLTLWLRLYVSAALYTGFYMRWIGRQDRKSTRLNSSHGYISYAVFCLKKKKQQQPRRRRTR